LVINATFSNISAISWQPVLVVKEYPERTIDHGPTSEDDGDSIDVVLPPPKMSLTVSSQDEVQLTMSKTCLEVLQNLGKVM
jgi:hypothetical protein